MKIAITTEGIIMDGNSVKFIRLCDYTGYNPDLGTNGGAYGFWDTLYINGDTVLKVSGTTAEFNICEEPQILTLAEAMAMIVSFIANMDNLDSYIEVEF